MSETIHSVNLDDNQTAFFSRQLEYVKAKTYDVQYPQFNATRLIPVSMEAGLGAETITYAQFDKLGLAKIISNYADDLPRSDVKGKEFTARIRSLGTSYGYSIQDIRAAQFAGRSLSQAKANAARQAIEQQINHIGWFGNPEYGMYGLLNNPNVTRTAVDLNAGETSTLWINKTADEILHDMNELVNGIVELTNGVEIPDTLLLPIAQYTLIASTPRSTNSDTTILQYFLTNNPFVNSVEAVRELKGAGEGEGAVAAGGDVMVAYSRNPDKLSFEIPQPFEQLNAQEHNLEFVVPVMSRVAGVLVYAPLSIAIGEGI